VNVNVFPKCCTFNCFAVNVVLCDFLLSSIMLNVNIPSAVNGVCKKRLVSRINTSLLLKINLYNT